jgi:alkanesulfonate monooxygenase SsuD/methylene tetrahydromethanopterin reductase-like flavin-dependent oxidoreductase (luciferase family)
MKFGVGMYSAQRPPGSARSFSDLYADMIRQAKLAEEVGLDSFWIAEHHFAEDGYVPAVLPVCAGVLASTQRLTAGTAVAIASFYNPVRLAEDAIALDLLSGGRFVLGLGTAYRKEEFEGFGVAPETDEARLDETVDILERAFIGRAFSYRGKHYQVPDLTVTPPPFTEGGPPLILAGDGVIDRDAQRAAQRGRSYMIDPALQFDEVNRLVELYDAASALDPKPELPVFNYGFISDDRDPWEQMRQGFTYLRQTYDRWGDRPVQEVHRENHRLILGTRDEVAAQVLEYRRLFGDRLHFIMRLDYPGQDPGLSDAAVRAFGDVAKIVRLRLGQK